MTDILGVYMSPRKGGNTDQLMDEFLRGAREAGAETRSIIVRDLKIKACIECGSCDENGECILKDDMQDLYPILVGAEKVAAAIPIFFYGAPAHAKALIDRCQALWNRIRLDPTLKRPDGRGFFIGVGATKGQNLFEGTVLCFKYWLDAMGLPLTMDSLEYRQVESKGAITEHPTALKEAYEAGRRFAEE